MPELNQVIALNRRGVRGGRKTKRLTMETRSARRSTESAIWLLRALDSERGTRLPLGRIAVEKSGRSRRFLRCAVCHQAFSATSGSVFADGFPLSHNLRTAAGRGAPTAAFRAHRVCDGYNAEVWLRVLAQSSHGAALVRKGSTSG